jgi:hypothetical protein
MYAGLVEAVVKITICNSGNNFVDDNSKSKR